MAISGLKRRIGPYDRGALRADVIAGVTVSALVIPKALGYAGIALVPIEFGLYAAAVGAIAAGCDLVLYCADLARASVARRALEEAAELPFLHAVHAAEAYSRLTGRIGVAAVLCKIETFQFFFGRNPQADRFIDEFKHKKCGWKYP